jgi:hypothetical protein
MTIPRMRITCWISKATYTHSEYVILIYFERQRCLHERASIVLCKYIACLVTLKLAQGINFVLYQSRKTPCFM